MKCDLKLQAVKRAGDRLSEADEPSFEEVYEVNVNKKGEDDD